MRYKKVTVRLTPYDETASELAQAEMGERGFESFVDTEDGFEGYIQETFWNDRTMEGVEPGIEDVGMTWEAEDAPDEDWNATWEQESFTPIDVDGRLTIRGPEHPSNADAEMEVVINPELAFGSGHHQTTRMIARWLMDNEMEGRTVMDMGCGTGILGIVAKKRGAKRVDAVDIDEWSVKNTKTNAELNSVTINAWEGDASAVESKRDEYDVFIANINRNILMDGMGRYAKSIKTGGRLVISGFLEEDMETLRECCKENRLEYKGMDKDDVWRMMWFIKI